MASEGLSRATWLTAGVWVIATVAIGFLLNQGAKILAYPGAFNMTTGPATTIAGMFSRPMTTRKTAVSWESAVGYRVFAMISEWVRRMIDWLAVAISVPSSA